MLTPVRLLPFLLAFLPTALQAQSTQADLEARLLHKPLYIRGLWRSDKLHFDPTGKILGDQARLPFTLSGIDVVKVKLKDGALLLDGRRIGIEFNHEVPRRIPLENGALSGNEIVKIEVDPASDFGPALQTIFADSLADLAPTLPFYWQPYARRHFLPNPDPTPVPSTEKPTGKMTAPRVLQSFEPQFSDAARMLGYGGSTLVRVKVNEQGKIIEASVLRPTGLGLDEQALAAAVRYRFAPALLEGKPVATEVNFEVSFSR